MFVAKKDIYADKDGKITSDPLDYASQIAVAGHVLNERVVKRYGISDELVSIDEPRVIRKVRSFPAGKKEDAAAEEKAADKPETDEPEAIELKAAASKKKAAAKDEGAKKK